MAYNRKNLLLKIIDIQQTTLEMKQRGVTQKWIYENAIREKYQISYRAFNNYLGVNAKKELKELNRVHAETNCNKTKE
ncbi:MAG: hypothetical protein JXK08_08955 [Flavobacteriaceae bacterium]|nr:hypothetical protein [Flavobacteriaceae bacterium]